MIISYKCSFHKWSFHTNDHFTAPRLPRPRGRPRVLPRALKTRYLDLDSMWEHVFFLEYENDSSRLLTCIYPHLPVRSQDPMCPGFRDCPCLSWLYRNSTENIKKVQKHGYWVFGRNKWVKYCDAYLRKHRCQNCSDRHCPYISSSFGVFSFLLLPSSFYLNQLEVMQTCKNLMRRQSWIRTSPVSYLLLDFELVSATSVRGSKANSGSHIWSSWSSFSSSFLACL